MFALTRLTNVAGGAMLLLTGTTLNVQSFMGAIMAIGIAVANAILLITFAEMSRQPSSLAEICSGSWPSGAAP